MTVSIPIIRGTEEFKVCCEVLWLKGCRGECECRTGAQLTPDEAEEFMFLEAHDEEGYVVPLSPVEEELAERAARDATSPSR